MQALPGFRDFLPADCAVRNYIFAQWRDVSRRYGFVEWDGAVLEPTDLYKKKSGEEIIGQLFNFTDKGGREVAMRPELTPTLARVIAAHEREFKKPLKWFSIPQCFRYEKQQRGRLREHFQLNCDLIGDSSEDADAEMIALLVDLLRSFGFTHDEVRVYVSHRGAWGDYLRNHGNSLSSGEMQEFLTVVDKIERLDETVADERLKRLGTSLQLVRQFIQRPEQYFDAFRGLTDKLKARGLAQFVTLRPQIVRGLAYYTGFVFEAFDRPGKLRAIAGGGRYDNLVAQLSDGAVSLPALGFAMGDVVLGELIRETPSARAQMEAAVEREQQLDVYVVIAKEERRADALAQVQALRDRRYRVDYPLTAARVGKQFQTAEHLQARFAVLFGDEWPQVKLKNMTTGEQERVQSETLAARLQVLF